MTERFNLDSTSENFTQLKWPRFLSITEDEALETARMLSTLELLEEGRGLEKLAHFFKNTAVQREIATRPWIVLAQSGNTRPINKNWRDECKPFEPLTNKDGYKIVKLIKNSSIIPVGLTSLGIVEQRPIEASGAILREFVNSAEMANFQAQEQIRPGDWTAYYALNAIPMIPPYKTSKRM